MIQKLITWWEGLVRMRNLRHMQNVQHMSHLAKAQICREINRDMMRNRRRTERQSGWASHG